MQRTGRSTMRAVVRFDYSPARTEANVMYDSQELDEEFDCSRNTVRTLGVRSFRTQQMVGVGGPVLAGIPMRASGVTAELLTVVCRTVPPPR